MRKHGAFLVEGRRFASDVLERAPGLVLEAVLSESAAASTEPPAGPWRTLVVPDRIFGSFSDTVHTQGIALVCRIPPDSGIPPAARRLLVLDRIGDPGNAGTLIRTAAAFSFDAVVAVTGTCSLFTPKVTRAAAAANAFLPVMEALSPGEVLSILSDRGFRMLVADSGGRPYSLLPVPDRAALVMGSEPSGVSRELLTPAATPIGVPQSGEVESLNVAAAGAILMSWLYSAAG